ncbi:MAG: tetratricopeptide repeat protein [Rhodobiaceae bacterium]|nr:tetratricopeptide repeat protein [Rhodobiaceae bacterium]MCC0056542.1 tetratricopeptide repeat protein [Rhodobiaceae bacterium]
MPIMVALDLIIQIGLAVHVIKTGRPYYWIFIILFFPLLGSLAYFLFEILPEVGNSRTGRKMSRNVSRAIDPEKSYRYHKDQLYIADTVENRRRLAEECLQLKKYEDAETLFDLCLEGPHEHDPALLTGLARARYGLGDFGGALDTLDRLREHNPDYQSQRAHMVYARALEGLGRTEEARDEYEALSAYFAGPEAKVRYGLMLLKSGEPDLARAQFEQIDREYGRRRKQMLPEDREWLDVARSNLR